MQPGDAINPHLMFTGVFIPTWLLVRPEISSSAKFVYGILCWCANKKTGAAFPSQGRMAVGLGVSERTVRYALAELVRQGLLKQAQLGKKCTNRYFFLWHRWMEGENEVTGNFCRTPKVTGNSASGDRQDRVQNDTQSCRSNSTERKKETERAGAHAVSTARPAREDALSAAEALQMIREGKLIPMGAHQPPVWVKA